MFLLERGPESSLDEPLTSAEAGEPETPTGTPPTQVGGYFDDGEDDDVLAAACAAAQALAPEASFLGSHVVAEARLRTALKAPGGVSRTVGRTSAAFCRPHDR